MDPVKNLIILALCGYIAAPHAYVLVDPEPIARSCPYDHQTFVCKAATWLWVEQDGFEYVNRKMFADRLDYQRLDQELAI